MEVKRKIKYHFYFWLAYFVFEINAQFLYLQEVFKNFSLQKTLYLSIISEFSFLITEIPAFYFILAIVDNKCRNLKNVYLKFSATILVFVIFIILYRVLSHDLIYPYYFNVQEEISRFSQFGIFTALMNVVFAVAIGLGFEKFIQQNEMQKKLTEISKEKSDAELKLLKTQINPHFLFNTLNNIYGLSIKKSEETPEIILKLSKIMRYNIFDSAKDKVSVQKEIENIQDFIDIQKIRHKSVNVEFNHIIDNSSQEISPLILLHFVENAFKHGASESRFNSFIKINLKLENQILFYEVENSKEHNVHKDSTKIGLNNIKRQLELLYPKHSLSINDAEDLYFVTLKILFE
ncbi:MAG TPA: histidine kinase [Chryseobacterium sp.]|nr:histidine kinase [Chryseobacterium sp.]